MVAVVEGNHAGEGSKNGTESFEGIQHLRLLLK